MKILAVALVLHFLADFVLQSRTMGKKKSEDLKWLAGHLAIQFSVMLLGLFGFIDKLSALYLALANTAIHGVIDWYIWRGYKWSVLYRLKEAALKAVDYRINQGKLDPSVKEKLVQEEIEYQAGHWKFWEDHWFFVTIGLDQLLHSLTLAGLVYIIVKGA